MKFALVILALVFSLTTSNALTSDEYVSFVDELLENKDFVNEYEKRAAQLFADPDYMYGPQQQDFPCAIPKTIPPPKNIHELSPIDVNCVGALGDSLTAALGAHAYTPVGLVIENRGISWSVGGDSDFSKILSFPNIIREYQKQVNGVSKKFSVVFLNGQNAKNNGLNTAKTGEVANGMPGQAQMLIDRIKKNNVCDWNNDWKVITIFVGGNDLCGFCKPENFNNYTGDNFKNQVKSALDILFNSGIPKTLVNLIPIFDLSQVESLNSGGLVCELFHKKTCPCAAYPSESDRRNLTKLVQEFQAAFDQILATNNYDMRDDFTVVVQPFFNNTILPQTMDKKPDFSLFAPDCFHFSGKGHSYAALSLWNNMLEPVGGKQTNWHYGEPLKCPSDKYPYFFTRKNSAAALAERFNMNRRSSSSSSSTARALESTQTSTSSSSHRAKPSKDPHDHDKHHHGHDKSYSSWSTASFVGLICVVALFLVLIVASVIKRQKIRSAIQDMQRSKYYDDDDVEVFSRSNSKTSLKSNEKLPKTLGDRINFE